MPLTDAEHQLTITEQHLGKLGKAATLAAEVITRARIKNITMPGAGNRAIHDRCVHQRAELVRTERGKQQPLSSTLLRFRLGISTQHKFATAKSHHLPFRQACSRTNNQLAIATTFDALI